MEAILRLFKALPINTKNKALPTEALLEETIKRGFVFSPEVIFNYKNDILHLLDSIEKAHGITGEKANTTFHKNWAKVKYASIEQLVIEQIIHYFTTYGAESVGLYDEDYVYIPKERLDVPGIDIDEIKLVVIKGYTKEELKDKLLKLLVSGIALKEETIKDVIDVAFFVNLNGDDVATIKNKEVRTILYDHLNLFPNSPAEFLRHMLYISTGKTLLIKSKGVIEEIKKHDNVRAIKYFQAYGREQGFEKLAEIFYRFKPIWLAFRTNRQLKIIINRIRRLANSYHKPMAEDYLNQVTAKLKVRDFIGIGKLEGELNKVNIFRKIRLAYALKYRTKDVDSILYRIRNGKSYATDFNFENKVSAELVLDRVLDSIIKDVSKNVQGKKIYIPDYINYSLPATEKQFVGNFPSGTYVSIPQDMIVGIHWDNVKNNRIDLDLSLLSQNSKFGWDAFYRDERRDILFSGDMTAAPSPNGATELFYIKKQLKANYIMCINYFNYSQDIKVPFKIIVAREKVTDFGRDYVVNQNNIVASVLSEISTRQKVLGLLSVATSGIKFYFIETSVGDIISSRNNKYTETSRKYLSDYYQNSIELKDILVKAGADIVDKDNCDIDLSPENLEKDGILNLLIKGE